MYGVPNGYDMPSFSNSPKKRRQKSPSMRDMPPWDNRAHVTFSKNNANYHT